MAFPTLSKQPLYPITQSQEDNIIRSSSEAGYELTRPRHTRTKRTFHVIYKALTNTDYSALELYFNTTLAYGSNIFSWTHPELLTVHNVRMKPIQWVLVRLNQWSAEFDLEEV